jgi:hypothetical protein
LAITAVAAKMNSAYTASRLRSSERPALGAPAGAGCTRSRRKMCRRQPTPRRGLQRKLEVPD